MVDNDIELEIKIKNLNARNFLKLTAEASRDNIFEVFLEATGNKRELSNELRYFIKELIGKKNLKMKKRYSVIIIAKIKKNI